MSRAGYITLLALSVYPLLNLYSRLSLFGAFRTSFPSAHNFPLIFNLRLITDIRQAEDLAILPSGDLIFAAQGNPDARYRWWPAWANFDDPRAAEASDGGLWILDPKTWNAKRLPITNFDNHFVTHGIDVYSDDTGTYLHAVNHRSNGPLPDSCIEIFQIESTHARHIETIRDPLITTPNDIVSLGPKEFLVTNDHVYRAGLLRTLEDLFTLKVTSRTNIVHVKEGKARVALGGLHNANGLGRGKGEILLGDASGGVLTVLSQDLETISSFQLPSTIDNPSYFDDPFATTFSNASAYVLGGMLKGWDLDRTSRDGSKNPSVVWLARRVNGIWEKQLVLEDDGSWLNGATVATIIPIPPAGKKREGWLVATGSLAGGVSVARIDLTDWAKKS